MLGGKGTEGNIGTLKRDRECKRGWRKLQTFYDREIKQD
jgi:hypothetical protein